MKYYEILPTHTETPRNTTCKIANLYIEFNYHFLTLQKNPITFEQECTNSIAIYLITMKNFIFSHRPPEIHYLFLLVVIAGDCTMTWAFHVFQKICHIKISLENISTFECSITIPLEYLLPVTVFQWNNDLQKAAPTSTPNIAQSAWMQCTL